MAETRRVLVVEDDSSIRQVLVEILELEGYAVRTAPDGLAALALLDAWRPDLIVLDLMMPRMDGWHFREVQCQRPVLRDIPVLVLSASRRLEASLTTLAPAAALPKPFDLDELLIQVDELTARLSA